MDCHAFYYLTNVILCFVFYGNGNVTVLQVGSLLKTHTSVKNKAVRQAVHYSSKQIRSDYVHLFAGNVVAVVAEGKTHALAVGLTALSTDDM